MPMIRLLTLLLLTSSDVERDQIIQTCDANNTLQPCAEGWYRLDADRCMTTNAIVAPFDKAESFCATQGGNLVSIRSQDDYNKVLCLLANDMPDKNLYWIGAKKQQGQYQWTDGSGPLTFTQWAPAKPGILQKDCVEMNYDDWGLWGDQSCSEKRLFVCEKTG